MRDCRFCEKGLCMLPEYQEPINCPFAIEETDTEEYGCRLTEAFKLLTDCTVSDEYA